MYALAMFCVAAPACTHRIEGQATQERVGEAIQPIISGSPSGALHDAVVVLSRFEDAGRKGLCTATLVAPNLLLTARHCVSVTDSSAMCDKDGAAVVGGLFHGERVASDYAVFVGRAGVAPPSTDEAQASAHGKRIVVDTSETLCNHDLAFVVLDRPVDAPIAPIRLGAPESGDMIAAVGWGITEAGALPTTRLARANVAVLGLGPLAFPEDPRYGIGNAEVLVGESACSGDSGSPLLAKSGAVVGVASRAGNGKPRDPANAASTCMGDGVHAVYTHLGNAKALVQEAFDAAGATPWIEGEPDPRLRLDPGTGDAGTAETTAMAPLEVAAPEATEPPAESAASGCAVSGAAPDDLIGRAIGMTALVAMLARLLMRRRSA